MLCAGGDQVEPGSLDVGMTKDIGKLNEIFAGLVKYGGKQVPQVVGKYFGRRYPRPVA